MFDFFLSYVENLKPFSHLENMQAGENVMLHVRMTLDTVKTYDYHKKLVTPRNSRLRLKPIAYAILIGLAIVALLAFCLVFLV